MNYGSDPTKLQRASRYSPRTGTHDVPWQSGLSADQLANIAASMAATSTPIPSNVTQYFFTVPSQDLDVALHIEATRMRAILATDDLWSTSAARSAGGIAGPLESTVRLLYKAPIRDVHGIRMSTMHWARVRRSIRPPPLC